MPDTAAPVFSKLASARGAFNIPPEAVRAAPNFSKLASARAAF